MSHCKSTSEISSNVYLSETIGKILCTPKSTHSTITPQTYYCTVVPGGPASHSHTAAVGTDTGVEVLTPMRQRSGLFCPPGVVSCSGEGCGCGGKGREWRLPGQLFLVGTGAESSQGRPALAPVQPPVSPRHQLDRFSTVSLASEN